MHADLQRLLAADLLSDFTSKSMDRLRHIRIELTEAEGDVSFIRRVTQGRLDIVGHEVERRAGGTAVMAGMDPSSALLFDLPEILTDANSGGATGSPAGGARTGAGRAVAVLEPGEIALAMVEQLDGIASPSQLSGVQEIDEAQLADLFGALREFEIGLSDVRRQLHNRIDTIQDEIARRYRDGEATVDALLK